MCIGTAVIEFKEREKKTIWTNRKLLFWPIVIFQLALILTCVVLIELNLQMYGEITII